MSIRLVFMSMLIPLLPACDSARLSPGDGGMMAPSDLAMSGVDAGACETNVSPGAGIAFTLTGAVVGKASSTTHSYVYQGIPYAAPPVGALRFTPPQTHACWAGELPTIAYGAMCPQIDTTSGAVVGDEDCLTMNVWTPANLATQPLPVMVFIHGGGNAQGSSAGFTSLGAPLYDGQALAESENVVVVTFNYRLGILGFLALPSLDAESAKKVSGNYGILDQIAALTFVQNNISAFGGDPKRVMIFGESAGAVDVCVLLASPLAAGLFQSALMESGACFQSPLATVETASQTVLAATTCATAADAPGCLRGLSTNDLVAAAPALVSPSGLGTGAHYGPNVDGWVLTDSPAVAIAAGHHNHVPFVVGSNSDETSESVPAVADDATYKMILETQFGMTIGDRIYNEYPTNKYGTARAAYSNVLTDERFTCTARVTARAAVMGQTEPVFRYFYTHALENAPTLKPFGAWHGAELPFVFQQLTIGGYIPKLAEIALSNSIGGYWSRLASGNPNAIGAAQWPVYAMATDPYLILDDSIAAASGVRSEQCDFWATLGL